MTAVYNYSRDANTKEGKELLKQKAELAQEQMAIKWSLINIARKSEDVFQPPEQCCSEIDFQQRERGLGWAGLGWCLASFWQGRHVLRARTPSRALGEPCYPTFICQCKYFIISRDGRKKDGKL